MARPTALLADLSPSEEAPPGAAPVYFLAVPEQAYKALSDAAAKKNLTLAQLLSEAVSAYLKNDEGR